MLAGLKNFSGTKLLPGMTFTDEVSSGWYRAGAGDIRFSLLAGDAIQLIDDTGTASGSQQPLLIWDGAAFQPALYAGSPGAVADGSADGQTLRWEASTSTWDASSVITITDAGGVELTGALELGGVTDTNGNQVQWSKGADVASAAALPVLTDGNSFDVTGTTTVTSINTTKIGTTILLQFDGILTLTHHATDLILPNGGANITTAAGDVAVMYEYATGDWRCASYTRASGAALQGLTAVVDDTTPQAGGDFDMNAHQMQWSKGADVASATALPVLTDGNYFDVTGTTTVTSIDATGGPGTLIKLHFDGILTLTHHATDLILPGGANITTAAGDEAEFVEYAAGDYRCTSYTKASGEAVVSPSGGAWTLLSTVTASASATVDVEDTFSSTYDAYVIVATDVVNTSGNSQFRCRLKIGGSYITTSTYVYSVSYPTSSAGTYAGNFGSVAAPTAFIAMTGANVGSTAQKAMGFTMWLDTPDASATNKRVRWEGDYISHTPNESTQISGAGRQTASSSSELTGVRFYADAGNVSGNFRLYGIKNS
tara:strand:- start:279 stop:1904 length:1626 start_codon:yes stop_codon:yes gene_type:complete